MYVFVSIRPLWGDVSLVSSGLFRGVVFLVSSGLFRGVVSYLIRPPLGGCFHLDSGTESPRGGTPVMRTLLLQTYQGEATWHRLPTQAQLWEKSGGDGSL